MAGTVQVRDFMANIFWPHLRRVTSGKEILRRRIYATSDVETRTEILSLARKRTKY